MRDSRMTLPEDFAGLGGVTTRLVRFAHPYENRSMRNPNPGKRAMSVTKGGTTTIVEVERKRKALVMRNIGTTPLLTKRGKMRAILNTLDDAQAETLLASLAAAYAA